MINWNLLHLPWIAKKHGWQINALNCYCQITKKSSQILFAHTLSLEKLILNFEGCKDVSENPGSA